MPIVPGELRQAIHHIEAAHDALDRALAFLSVQHEPFSLLELDLLNARTILLGIEFAINCSRPGYTAPPLPPGNW